MKDRNIKRKGMTYEVMDCCNLRYPDNFFDIAIDKSTIDALLCGDNSFLMTALMLKEGQRVIKESTGVYFTISYGKPSTRAFHFERPFLSWKMKEYVFYPISCDPERNKDENGRLLRSEEELLKEKEEKSHYIYVCIK
jgi:ubiquinone/menaquinone biosynthesis C-methylase UbiE